MRFFVLCCVAAIGAVGAGCGDDGGADANVNCQNLCARTLACEVTFAPSDDPEGAKIVAGDRTDAESCALGCTESPIVTADHASCIDALVITGDAAACQKPVLECLELPTE